MQLAGFASHGIILGPEFCLVPDSNGQPRTLRKRADKAFPRIVADASSTGHRCRSDWMQEGNAASCRALAGEAEVLKCPTRPRPVLRSGRCSC